MAKPKFYKPPPPYGPGWHLIKTAVKAILALALGFGALAGLAWLGTRAGNDVAPNARYTVAFAEIECDAPPGLEAKPFLTEVRFINDLPETLQSVDPKLSEHLKAAFAKHPWVLEVGAVTVTAQGTIRVELTFRESALDIKIGSDPEPRVLDRTGVLLPKEAKGSKLPLLVNRLVPMNVSAGQKWPDPDVLRAVEIVRLYPCEKIERVLEGWQLALPGGKLLRIAAP